MSEAAQGAAAASRVWPAGAGSTSVGRAQRL